MTRRANTFVSIRFAACTAALAASGCGPDLPLAERIASTRPLAMRVEAVDPTADPAAPARAEVLPFERVRLVPFIVDDEGPLTLDEIAAELEPLWLACALQPVQGLFACLESKLPLQAADIPDCPDFDLADFDPTSGELPVAPSPCRITGGTPAQPELDIGVDPNFLLGGDLEVTMVAHVPGQGTTEACLEPLLTEGAALPAECIYVGQRVPIGPDAQLQQLAADFGAVDPEQLGPIPETIPDPDTNPRIQRVTVQIFDPDDVLVETVDVVRGEPLQVPIDHRLEIEAEAPESDLQTYLIRADDGFAERDETYDGHWFRTWGDLLSPSSDDPLSLNTWILTRGEQDETDLPPGNRATLFYVLRDDRQGVDWWWFFVDVTE